MVVHGVVQSLAKRLEEQGATMFGAYWCSHCYAQKQLFGADAFARIRYVECARDGVNSQAALCREKQVPVRVHARRLCWVAALLFGSGRWGVCVCAGSGVTCTQVVVATLCSFLPPMGVCKWGRGKVGRCKIRRVVVPLRGWGSSTEKRRHD